jgi:hypothetical protein
VAVGLLLAIRWWTALSGPPDGAVVHLRLRDESAPEDDSMRERHLGLLRQARRRGVPAKSVTRWVNLAPPGPDRPVDLVATCAAAAAAVESMINNGPDGVRMLLAADMPWPAALAVGAQLPITADPRLLELTGSPCGTGVGAPEATFSLPWRPPRSLEALTIERWTLPDAAAAGRVGLLLALTRPQRYLDPAQVFAGHGVGECHLVQPSWVAEEADDDEPYRFTGQQLAGLARRLPAVLAAVKQRCRGRELAVVAAMPSTLAMAVGWGLARDPGPFFAGTYLLYDDESNRGYLPLRVHPSQPVGRPR